MLDWLRRRRLSTEAKRKLLIVAATQGCTSAEPAASTRVWARRASVDPPEEAGAHQALGVARVDGQDRRCAGELVGAPAGRAAHPHRRLAGVADAHRGEAARRG